MAVLSNKKYKCIICGKEFSQEIECDIHRNKDHDIVYLPLTTEDLNRLYQFIYFKNDELLTESLTRTIITYAQTSAKNKLKHAEND